MFAQISRAGRNTVPSKGLTGHAIAPPWETPCLRGQHGQGTPPDDEGEGIRLAPAGGAVKREIVLRGRERGGCRPDLESGHDVFPRGVLRSLEGPMGRYP
ncbi:hypothetical protein GCM10018783_00780 [Streptomyces griseosporeus]|nr:hypothetical protein GCM10018783_00780 [Streptomyces griseosporeus]